MNCRNLEVVDERRFLSEWKAAFGLPVLIEPRLLIKTPMAREILEEAIALAWEIEPELYLGAYI